MQANNRFYKHTVLVILGLLVAHMVCFIASVVLIESQKQYIEEVVDAGSAVITLHRMCLDCRWVLGLLAPFSISEYVVCI